MQLCSDLVSKTDCQILDCDTVPHKQILVSESIDSLVIGTYNVLFPQPYKRGDFCTSAGYSVTANHDVIPNDAWRRQIKIMNILNVSPNCLAMQEVTQEEFDEYQKKLEPYKGILCLHPKSSHGVAIFYKSAEFHRIAAIRGVFQYNVNTTSKNGNPITLIKSRVHLLVDLQDKLSGMVLRMVSCHLFDPRDWDQAKKSMHIKAVLLHAKTHLGYVPDITAICGDMNQDQFGDDVTACLSEHPKAVGLQYISAFIPFMHDYKHDNNLKATAYEKDLSKVDGEMISTKRKTDWIFIKTGEGIEELAFKGVVLQSAKYPNLKKTA